jgi:hypothetical protein
LAVFKKSLQALEETMKNFNMLSMCFLSAVISAFTVAWFMAASQYLEQYDNGFISGFKQGYDQGGNDALRTNPVSVRLEHACASIWVSEQVVEQHRRGIK